MICILRVKDKNVFIVLIFKRNDATIKRKDTDMEKTALLIVDVQCALIEAHPYNEMIVIDNICKLIKVARENRVEVIYVQHDGGIGDEFEKYSKGWELYRAVTPIDGDKIFNKVFNSAFKETGLHEYLCEKGIDTLILTGMQTEYCIDTTCKVAFEYGYKQIIPMDATTTLDNNFLSGEVIARFYEQDIWNHRYAEVITVDDVINILKIV